MSQLSSNGTETFMFRKDIAVFRKPLKSFFIAILAFAMTYLVGAFMSATFNIAQWDALGRFFCGVIGVGVGVGLVIYYQVYLEKRSVWEREAWG
jgi:uncharacterized membrane protein YcjF (UPF0283 family)